MIIKKTRDFNRSEEIQKDSHNKKRFSQMITSVV